jgi:hypothetical protein
MQYRVQAASRPLAGMVIIRSGSGRAILICLASAKSTTASSCFAVTAAKHFWVKRSQDGTDQELDIEATDGAMTLLRLHPASGQP